MSKQEQTHLHTWLYLLGPSITFHNNTKVHLEPRCFKNLVPGKKNCSTSLYNTQANFGNVKGVGRFKDEYSNYSTVILNPAGCEVIALKDTTQHDSPLNGNVEFIQSEVVTQSHCVVAAKRVRLGRNVSWSFENTV